MKWVVSKVNNLAFLRGKQIFLLILMVTVSSFLCPALTYPSFSRLSQSDEKKPQQRSEEIIRESKEKPVTALKLGMEIQSVSNELEYYIKEIEAKKKEKLNLAKQIRAKSNPGQATGPPEEMAKLSKEIEKIDTDIRAKQEIVKDLEKELSGP